MERITDRFKLPKTSGISFPEKTMTQQHHKNECDVNQIVAKAKKRGFLTDPLTGDRREPLFGDFSEAEDYHTARIRIAQADEKFLQLPAALRRRFNHDPAQLLNFLEDENNRDEAAKLGLLKEVVKPPAPVDPPPAG